MSDSHVQGLLLREILNRSFSLGRCAMEPFCPLLLASFSLSLARAGQGNDTTPAESNWTSTTAGKDP